MVLDKDVRIFKETTSDWGVKYNVPNNIYIVKFGKLIGYIKEGEKTIIPIHGKDGKGMNFEKRGRKFETISRTFLTKNFL